MPHRRRLSSTCIPAARRSTSCRAPSSSRQPTRTLRQRNIAAVLAFDAPLTVVIDNLGEPRTSTATSVRAGLVTVGTEMAGAGTVSIDALEHLPPRGPQRARRISACCRRSAPRPEARPESILRIPGHDGYVLATAGRRFRAVPRARDAGAGRRGGGPHPQSGRSGAARPRRCSMPPTASSTAGASPGRVVAGNCCVDRRGAVRGGPAVIDDRRHRAPPPAGIAGNVRRTPVIDATELKAPVAEGCALTLKLELLQVTGSFKARGATNRLLVDGPGRSSRGGIVAASGGNHGIAVARAGHDGGRADDDLPAVERLARRRSRS